MANSHLDDAEWHAHLKQDGEQALAKLFVLCHDRLRTAVEMRMDPRLQARADPSDILQESFVEAQHRLPDYLANPNMPPFLWIRFLTLQRLMIVYRKNVEVKARDARRELSLDASCVPGASSCWLAAKLVDDGTTPSQAVSRVEREQRLQRALDQLDPIDREIIALRHIEQLDNLQTARILNLKPNTASKRYLRALKRLKTLLSECPTGDNPG